MKQLVIVGHPLSHTLSPIMHNTAFKALGLNEEYHYDTRPLLREDLPDFVQSIRNGEIEGGNITIPYKTQIMSLLSSFSTESIVLGAVNTLYRDKGQVVGCNTDVVGFTQALKAKGVDVQGFRAIILGAGGAAKAVAYALIEGGVERLVVLNRTHAHAQFLVDSFHSRKNVEISWVPIPNSKEEMPESDLLVNCTPVGMSGHSPTETPLNASLFSKNMVVMDVVYNPQKTRFLEDAQRVGCKTIDGVDMLVYQGAASFELWTGEKPPVEIMRSAVLEALGGRSI